MVLISDSDSYSRKGRFRSCLVLSRSKWFSCLAGQGNRRSRQLAQSLFSLSSVLLRDIILNLYLKPHLQYDIFYGRTLRPKQQKAYVVSDQGSREGMSQTKGIRLHAYCMVLTRKGAEKGRLRPKASVSMHTAWCLLEREQRRDVLDQRHPSPCILHGAY